MDALHKYAPRPLAADMKKARMHPHKTWSAEDDALLRNTFPHHATQVVAAILGRTTPAVASHARALGLRKTHAYRAATARRTTRKRSPWTPQIEELMVLLYPYCITHQLEDLFGIPSVAIRQKALYMGLKKNTAAKRHIAQMRNLTLRQAAQAAGPGPSASTQVRARNKNRTAKGGGKTTIQPIGTVRLRTWSGVPNTLVEKVGLPSQWRQVHQLVWEHANGRPIPKGFVVTFRDKNRFNLNPENLELVSRSEWSLRVSPLCSADACPELKYITRLRGTLSRVTRQAEQRLQRSSTTPGAAGA